MRKGPRMASDYGDDAGEKMIEDFARFGERMGERAMYDRARRMRSAFENATAATRGAAGEGDAREKPAEWAKLDMAKFREIEGYDGVESTPIPLTPFTPPSGGLRLWASWPLRTRRG